MKATTQAGPPVVDLRKSLSPGSFVFWNKEFYQIAAFNPGSPQRMQFRNVVTAERVEVSLFELFSKSDDADSGPVFAPSLEALHLTLERRCLPARPISTTAGLPPRLIERADRIIATIAAIDGLVAEMKTAAHAAGEKFRRTPALKRACDQYCESGKKIGYVTYYKWHKLYEKCGKDRGRLACALRRSTFNRTRFTKAQLLFLDKLLLRYYARRDIRLRRSKLYREVATSLYARTQHLWVDPDKCRGQVPEDLIDQLMDDKIPMQAILDNPQTASLLTTIKLPHESSFYRYTRWFETQSEYARATYDKRYGKEMWEREQMLFDIFCHLAQYPLQYVFADHCLLDVFIVDEETRSVTTRLWLTVLLDCYSRSIVGLALLVEPPCIESIQSALRHAIWPKSEEFGEWIQYGIPIQLSLDNAWAHMSHSLENLARTIGRDGEFNTMNLVWRPPYKGRYGALIERYFGNLAGTIKELLTDAGAIQSSDPKAIRSARQTACLLHQDIYRFVCEQIVQYHHRHHSELDGLTPHQKWLQGIEGGGPPKVPPLTAEIERLFWRMSPETRVIGTKGISAFNMHYSSYLLATAKRRDMNGALVRYSYHYDINDISVLALFVDGAYVCDVEAKELRLADGSLLHISLAERETALELARKNEGGTANWIAYLAGVQALKAQRQCEKREAAAKPRGRKRSSKSASISLADAAAMDSALARAPQNEHDATYTRLLAGFVGGTNGTP